MAFGNSYHAECFKYMGCHGNIGSNERFTCTEDGEDGRKRLIHWQFYSQLYGLKCAACHQIMQGDSSGRVTYKKHPFFDTKYMCPSIPRIPSGVCRLFRFKSMDTPFASMNDADRCVSQFVSHWMSKLFGKMSFNFMPIWPSTHFCMPRVLCSSCYRMPWKGTESTVLSLCLISMTREESNSWFVKEFIFSTRQNEAFQRKKANEPTYTMRWSIRCWVGRGLKLKTFHRLRWAWQRLGVPWLMALNTALMTSLSTRVQGSEEDSWLQSICEGLSVDN